MIVEQFKNEDPLPVRERFLRCGRLLPGGLTYLHSWIDEVRGRCFQVMEAEGEAVLDAWMSRWSDIIDFEVVPVVSPVDYWSRIGDSDGTPRA